jgi:hypothetical protein
MKKNNPKKGGNGKQESIDPQLLEKEINTASETPQPHPRPILDSPKEKNTNGFVIFKNNETKGKATPTNRATNSDEPQPQRAPSATRKPTNVNEKKKPVLNTNQPKKAPVIS